MTKGQRRPGYGSEHSLLLSLGVSCVLVLGYALLLGAFGDTTMAASTVERGLRATTNHVWSDASGVHVELPDGSVDDLSYVRDAESYRAPMEIVYWRQPQRFENRVEQLVFAEQDVAHLTGENRRRMIAVAFTVLVAAFVVAAVTLNWPRERRPD